MKTSADMKDTIITSKRKKTEIIAILVSFLLAVIMNIYAILRFDTNWNELLTKIHFILLISLIFYFTTIILRLLYHGILYIIGLFN